MLTGDARSLHRAGRGWRVETNEGGIDAPEVVVALGPWLSDLLKPLGLKLPLMVKRGYHRHFHAQGNAGLARPVLDTDAGYLITPMQQGIRITTGVEFAAARMRRLRRCNSTGSCDKRANYFHSASAPTIAAGQSAGFSRSCPVIGVRQG